MQSVRKPSGTIYCFGRQKILTRLGMLVSLTRVNDTDEKQKSYTNSSFKDILVHLGYTVYIN